MASEEDSYSTLTVKGTLVTELRVTDIKRELDKRGLSKSGSKTQLLDRLKAQLLLEKLQQDAAQSSGDELEGKVPNRALQQDDKAGQSEFVRQYLQQQQRNLEIQMEMKKQVEEEGKRKSADESSADELKKANVCKEADNPDMTLGKKFKDDTVNAPAKEGAKMSKPARKGASSQEGEQRKERSESPVPERERQRESPQSRSSSSRSPSPDISSRSRRGRSSRGRAKKGGGRRGGRQGRSRSSSPSSSPEVMSKKKQRHRTNSSSHSGSRSPQITPDMPARRSSRHSSTTVKTTPDHSQEKEMSCNGSGKQVEKNENTSSERKWRKEQSEVTKDSPETVQSKEGSAKSTSTTASTVHSADKSKDRKEQEEFTNAQDKPNVGKEPEIAESSVIVSESVQQPLTVTKATKPESKANRTQSQPETKILSAKASNPKESVSGDPVPLAESIESTVLLTKESSAEKVESEKNKLVSEEDKNETRDQHLAKNIGEKSRTNVQKEMVTHGKRNSPSINSRRRRNRSSDSSSERSRSRSKSPARKKQSRSRSSNSSRSDSQSRSRFSSSGSSTDRSPTKEMKKSGQVQMPIKDKSARHSHSPERIVRADSSRKDASVPKIIDQYRKDDKASTQLTISSEPKSKILEEKQKQLGKEQEGKSNEAKGQQEIILGDQDTRSGKMTELKDQSKAGSNADTDEVAKKGIKKRKWGSKTSKAAKTNKRTSSIEISSDVLKNLIGDVKLTETVFEMETEVVNTLDYDEHEEDRRDVKVKRNVIQSPHEEEMITEQEDARRVESREETSPEHTEVPSEPEKKIIKLSSAAPKVGTKTKLKDKKKSKEGKKKGDIAGKENKDDAVTVTDKDSKEKVFVTTRTSKPMLPVVDEPEPVSGTQSPARNPPNRVVRIAGLVRPFTVGQLKELLRRTGELDDEYFWINAIKSHCLAAYKTQEEAIATRAALHGTRWPQSNPKILIVDFATVEDVMHRKAEGDVPLPALGKRPQEEPKKLKEQKIDEEREKRPKEKEQREKGREEREKEKRDTRDRKREPEKKNPIREWDRDKIQQLSRSRSKSKERERVTRRSRSRDRDHRKRGDQNKEKKEEDRRKERKQKDTKTEEEPPAKLLDDLFRKTKATPCIYWLPLTEEQAQQRLVKKLEQEKERQKRVAAAEEREKEELRKRETARLERQRERERARDKSRERNRQERNRSSRSRSKRRR